MTVIALGPEAGSFLANVNRWRQQLQLEPITDAELPDQSKHLQVDGREGDYVELLGPEDRKPRKAMLAVMVKHGGKSWFIKLAGDAPRW